MATITGKLESVLGGFIDKGTVEIALSGYGSQIPRGGGQYLISRPTSYPEQIPVGDDGTFACTLLGNDQIEPPGTYYTVTIKDANGDVVQCNAYIFLGGSAYDLNVAPPFDPTQPPPPLPPLIYNQLLIIPSSATPNFPGDQYTAWAFSLTQDVTAATLSGIVAGNLYTFIITQDITGGRKFVWPPTVLDAMEINPERGGASIQTFVAIANNVGPLLPIGPGAYYP